LNLPDCLFPLFPILYAEIHYTLKGFSLVYRPWPEIISDAPHRVEPGQSIPILLLIKDAHRFRISLHSVQTVIEYPDGSAEKVDLIDEKINIHQPWWYHIEHVRPKPDFSGPLRLHVSFYVQRQGKKKPRIVRTDNYRGTSHRPLTIFVAKEPYPRFDNWHFGDLHFHSDLTSDQVEFGAPLDATADIARAMGLAFSAVTDHSYDLDDLADDYLRNDPHLSKWRSLQDTVQNIEQEKGFIFLPGEEVSCGNQRGKNVHLLLLNNRRFFHGTGDSADRWFRNKPENTIPQILDELDENALAFAAHPEDAFTFLHRLLLSRGRWNDADYRHARLNGIQILNGVVDNAFRRGVKRWIKLLLQGRRIIIIAGNDSHGNFNRFRQLRLPFLCFREHTFHLFGKVRTCVYTEGKPKREDIIRGIQNGHCYITTGPAMILDVKNEKGESAGLGDRLSGNRFHLIIRGRSTQEFGCLESCKIWLGMLGSKKETLLFQQDRFGGNHTMYHAQDLQSLVTPSYLRGELITRIEENEYFCLTNPIWLY